MCYRPPDHSYQGASSHVRRDETLQGGICMHAHTHARTHADTDHAPFCMQAAVAGARRSTAMPIQSELLIPVKHSAIAHHPSLPLWRQTHLPSMPPEMLSKKSASSSFKPSAWPFSEMDKLATDGSSCEYHIQPSFAASTTMSQDLLLLLQVPESAMDCCSFSCGYGLRELAHSSTVCICGCTQELRGWCCCVLRLG